MGLKILWLADAELQPAFRTGNILLAAAISTSRQSSENQAVASNLPQTTAAWSVTVACTKAIYRVSVAVCVQPEAGGAAPVWAEACGNGKDAMLMKVIE